MASDNDGKGCDPDRQDRIRHPSEQHRRQFPKNVALLLVLVSFCLLFYLVAIVRMGGG
ncbi:MAG: hypothetical protein AB7G39_00545 [Alphaproteobacteria bacterium]